MTSNYCVGAMERPMPVSDGTDSKTVPELLRHASVIDQFRIPYPRGPLEKPPAVDADPGRFRNTAFFTKMYGDCKKGEVSPHLVSVAWLPKAWGKSIRLTVVRCGPCANALPATTEISRSP
jgi:hypothetical protein